MPRGVRGCSFCVVSWLMFACLWITEWIPRDVVRNSAFTVKLGLVLVYLNIHPKSGERLLGDVIYLFNHVAASVGLY